MPTLNERQRREAALGALTFDQAIAPAVLKMYGGGLKRSESQDQEEVTLIFPDMDSAAKWATTTDLSDYTFLRKAWGSFGSTVTVDVMRPCPED